LHGQGRKPGRFLGLAEAQQAGGGLGNPQASGV